MRNWFLLLAGFGILLVVSCKQSAPSDWTELIPEKTPFLIVPEEGRSLQEMLNAPYMPVFDDVSSSAISLTGELVNNLESGISLLAILLYPDTSNEWQPVWVTQTTTGLVSYLTQRFQRRFIQNHYDFKNHTVEILYVSDRIFYIVESGPFTLISESSLAIEDMLRTFDGTLPAMALTDEMTRPGSFVTNTPNLGRWIEQLALISYRPYLSGTFAGSQPLAARLLENNPDGAVHWKLQGHMSTEDETSPLVRSISGAAKEIQLDRYISTNTAGFSIFRLEPASEPAAGQELASEFDKYLEEHREMYTNIASTLDEEIAFITFAESGFISSSEFLFLRLLDDPSGLRNILGRLSREGLIEPADNGTWYLHSSLLGKLVGSEISPLTNFYFAIHGNAAALSRSRSLVENVGVDYERRRSLYYDDSYTEIRESLPEALSSFTYVNTPELNSFLQPWLYPQNYFGALSSSLEILTITTARNHAQEPLNVEITSRTRETTDVPYRERWIFPVSTEITGTPVLADISGTSRNEILFATNNGTLYVLASDGTTVTQASTGTDRPIGSPVSYDWYGNNQNVIMQAAGNKIYAWNETGSLLPNFPIVLEEEITSPLQVTDVTRNGVAEVIVATADRNVHILNSRGDAISGWPRTTNSVIRSKPVIVELNNQRSIFAFAENGLHAWNINGARRDGFPVFIESQYVGSPVIFNNHILGSGADGNLYATGIGNLFADSLAASAVGDSLITQSLNISNSSLTRSPSVYNEMIQVNEELVREDLILTQSRGGAVQIYNREGELRFAENMGQPASETLSPLILDINNDERKNVLSLGDTGRLYVWDLISGRRIQSLPTSAMRYPLFADLNSDGNIEIITQTREGLRVWSVFR